MDEPGYLRTAAPSARIVRCDVQRQDTSSRGVVRPLLGTTGGLNGPDGVGGDASVRGLTAYRLQGRVKLLFNGELRWRFLSVPHFDFGVTGSLDAGRVWSRLGSGEPGPLLAGGAAGLRIAWNRNFVIRFDYGIGISEKHADGNIYLTFDEMF